MPSKYQSYDADEKLLRNIEEESVYSAQKESSMVPQKEKKNRVTARTKEKTFR